MTNNEQLPGAQPEKRNALTRIFLYLKKKLCHNLGWKIASLVLAICLWGGLITQDTSLPRDRVIDGVRVTVANAAALKSNGLVVVSGLDDDLTVRLRVRVPQRYYSTVTSANYTARLDLNQIQGTGRQSLKITASSANTTLYGTVTEVFTPEITVEVAEYAVQSRVPVEVRLTGETPAGLYPAALTFSPQFVDIGGPKEIVDAAVRCVVEYDQSALSVSRNPNSVNLAYVFEDAQGNPLNGDNLTVTVAGTGTAAQRIAVSQYAYAMAQVPVNTQHLIRGEPPAGYQVTDIEVNPAVITIAGREAAVAPYLQEGAALFPYEQIDVSRRQQSVSSFLALRLPSNMEYVSGSVVQVTVTIEPVAAEETAGQTQTP